MWFIYLLELFCSYIMCLVVLLSHFLFLSKSYSLFLELLTTFYTLSFALIIPDIIVLSLLLFTLYGQFMMVIFNLYINRVPTFFSLLLFTWVYKFNYKLYLNLLCNYFKIITYTFFRNYWIFRCNLNPISSKTRYRIISIFDTYKKKKNLRSTKHLITMGNLHLLKVQSMLASPFTEKLLVVIIKKTIMSLFFL